MNRILKNNGEYLSDFFRNEKATWRLISTESAGTYAMDALDTFKNESTGAYSQKKRQEVFDAAEKKMIWITKPIPNVKEKQAEISF